MFSKLQNAKEKSILIYTNPLYFTNKYYKYIYYDIILIHIDLQKPIICMPFC